MDIKIVNETKNTTSIKVVGTGGGGGNAVNRMIQKEIKGVEFVALNTDAQDLERSLAPVKIQIGEKLTGGLGAGGKPEVGRKAAEEDRETISDLLEGADMVFVTAGMGGGTGTGSAPVVAEIAKEKGALTVAIVTKPFDFERVKKQRLAEEGITKLEKMVDSLIVIPNENLFKLEGNRGAQSTIQDVFFQADEILRTGVQGVSDLITQKGLMNIDFADVRSVMQDQGKALFGLGEASGEGRAAKAATTAIANPLLDDIRMEGAKGLLVNITGGTQCTLEEMKTVMEIVGGAVDEDADVFTGLVVDESLGEKLRVTVIATGFTEEDISAEIEEPAEPEAEETGSSTIQYSEWSEMISSQKHLSLDGERDSEEDENLAVPAYLRKKRSLHE